MWENFFSQYQPILKMRIECASGFFSLEIVFLSPAGVMTKCLLQDLTLESFTQHLCRVLASQSNAILINFGSTTINSKIPLKYLRKALQYMADNEEFPSEFLTRIHAFERK